MKTVILTNVGTPQSTDPKDVGIYLREFLMDENIISIPRPWRDFLVKVLIVPKRKYSSAEKYKRIWTEKGSPLMVETLDLVERMQNQLGSEWKIEIGMQIGRPSLKEAVEKAIRANSEIYFLPLYPQFATATTGGALKALKSWGVQVKASLGPFYHEEWFIEAQAQLIRERLKPGDHLLLSYHGLPISQLKAHKSDCYEKPNCCQMPSACLRNCYRAQCLQTSELLKKQLQLSEVSIGFQSRLGRAKWIEPSTTQVVDELLAQGVQHLKVACPSFVSDCLETLEEIGLELKDHFLKNGGKSFELIPCVNSNEIFIQGLCRTLQKMSEH